ncbi:MAG: hypothetical protein NZM42_12595 [Gemmatales bacterium]|nr:hypothetical protein [Gemmatales bacterium]
MKRSFTLSVLGLGLLVAGALGQNFAPPKAQVPDKAMLTKIQQRLESLEAKLNQLVRRLGKSDSLTHPYARMILGDIGIYYKAAQWIIRHQEWYRSEYPQWTLEILERGIQRADQVLTTGRISWLPEVGPVCLGYRSSVDGSWQPYAVYLPADFARNPDKKRRLDVILHGRQATLTEVSFLYEHERATVDKTKDYIELHVYGRGNNGYRWAGETDVLEAVLNWAERFPEAFDPDRVVLRGFSMGGAGAWHLGLHYPHLWCSVSPGAGFTTTRGYVKNLPEPLPPYQEACLKIYDAVDYAENAYNVPIVAYGGELDPQLQAARNIEARLQPLGIPMTLIVGPQTEHRYHPESLKKILELQSKHASTGRPKYPERIRFVTYHPQYSNCYWLTVLPDKLYEPCRIEAHWKGKHYEVKTENVAAFILRLADEPKNPAAIRCRIDGQEVESYPDLILHTGDWLPQLRAGVCFRKTDQQWRREYLARMAREIERSGRKRDKVAGPIDDVFRAGFLCVTGTGTPWNARVNQYAQASLDRFRQEWSKYMRGELVVVPDTEVFSELLANNHLVLFGDPGSNRVLASILDYLPLTWTKPYLEWAGQRYDATEHVPVMCYPSPFAPNRMIVINSGHTFHQAEFEGSNALLFPRLGDYAILRLKSGNDPLAAEVVVAGLFDNRWRLQPGRP